VADDAFAPEALAGEATAAIIRLTVITAYNEIARRA
jgi:hypothetical protein